MFSILFINLNAQSKQFDRLIRQNLNNTVKTIRVDSIKNTTNFVFLDTREIKEYETSHIQHAICTGYDNFDIVTIEQQIQDKNTPIIVYCSIGIRSEHIGEKLINAGYTNVQNLYGGIFEWKNQNNNVYTSNNTEPTDNVHTFSKEWSKWLTNGIKIYEY